MRFGPSSMASLIPLWLPVLIADGEDSSTSPQGFNDSPSSPFGHYHNGLPSSADPMMDEEMHFGDGNAIRAIQHGLADSALATSAHC
jgi:hypothetical protein